MSSPIPSPRRGPHRPLGPWTPERRYTPGVGAHLTTPSTPHRPPEGFYEIANPLGYEEKRAGMGGGIGSERHIQDLMGGMSVVIILAMALVSSLAFPPLFIVWILVGIWITFVHLIQPYGRRQLELEELARQRAAGIVPPEHAVPAQRWEPGK